MTHPKRPGQAVAEQVYNIIAETLSTDGMKLRDHTYENLMSGNWSITWDGLRGWPNWAAENVIVPGVFIEPINDYTLGVYPLRFAANRY